MENESPIRALRFHRAALVLLGTLALGLLAAMAFELLAQGPPGGPPGPPTRSHTVRQSDGQPETVPAKQQPPGRQRLSITVEGETRIIRSNGIPDHAVGAFPNRGNPNRIAEQLYSFRIPTRPQPAARPTPLRMQLFGIAVNGVPFDPGAAEWYRGDRRGGWQYEALSGAVALGLDHNYAHVQPTGAYHYHGLPTLLLQSLGVNSSHHSPLVGWAADGFPIYAVYGYAEATNPESGVVALSSSWRLKKGKRPSGGSNPGGVYDGTFLADFEYVEGLGALDECNGRRAVTPEFPGGTYAYFLSQSWPVIPRCFSGSPSKDFEMRRGPGGPGGRRGRPGPRG